jgi:integrase/recombinase XerD
VVEGMDLAVLDSKDLTNSYDSVKGGLPKYWERDFIVGGLAGIENPGHKMFFTFLWMTGVRVSEALNLRRRDINPVDFVVRIRWQKSRKWSERNIPLHPHLRDLLILFSASLKSDDLLFPFGRQRAWQLAQKYFGGSPHQFRHSFAVNWLRGGGDFVLLSRMLGHSDLKTTMVYLNIVPIDTGKELLKIQF